MGADILQVHVLWLYLIYISIGYQCVIHIYDFSKKNSNLCPGACKKSKTDKFKWMDFWWLSKYIICYQFALDILCLFYICPSSFSCFCHHGIFNRIQELDYQLSPSVWSKCGTPESVINHHVQWTVEGMVILSICSIGFDHNLEQKLVYFTRIAWSILI